MKLLGFIFGPPGWHGVDLLDRVERVKSGGTRRDWALLLFAVGGLAYSLRPYLEGNRDGRNFVLTRQQDLEYRGGQAPASP